MHGHLPSGAATSSVQDRPLFSEVVAERAESEGGLAGTYITGRALSACAMMERAITMPHAALSLGQARLSSGSTTSGSGVVEYDSGEQATEDDQWSTHTDDMWISDDEFVAGVDCSFAGQTSYDSAWDSMIKSLNAASEWIVFCGSVDSNSCCHP